MSVDPTYENFATTGAEVLLPIAGLPDETIDQGIADLTIDLADGEGPQTVVERFTTINGRFDEILNVKNPRFGAIGDGVADDTAALNAVFAYARTLLKTVITNVSQQGPTIFFPPGVYRVTDTINATGLRAGSWGILGDGAVIYGTVAGKPVLDMMNCRFYRMRGLTITGDSSTVPSFGLITGCITDSNNTGEWLKDGVNIDGFFTVSSYYNLASETVCYLKCRFFNDYTDSNARCMILDTDNSQDIESAFVTQQIVPGTPHSFNENLFISVDCRKVGGGSPIEYKGFRVDRHEWQNCYSVSYDDYIMRCNLSGGARGLWVDMNCEATGALGSILINNTAQAVTYSDFRFRSQGSTISDAVINCTSDAYTVTLNNVDIECGAPPSTAKVFGDGTAGSPFRLLVTGTIRWHSTTGINLANCQFNGTLITPRATVGTHAAGTYDIMSSPIDATGRTREFKGRVRISGDRDSTTAPNYLDLFGATGGTVGGEAAGSSAGINIQFTPKGVGRFIVGGSSALRFPSVASAPASPANGDVYYNSSTHKLQVYANGVWVDLH